MQEKGAFLGGTKKGVRTGVVSLSLQRVSSHMSATILEIRFLGPPLVTNAASFTGPKEKMANSEGQLIKRLFTEL